MPTTTKGYPYPASTDPPNGPAQIQALAQFLDGLVPFRMYVGTVSVTLTNVAAANVTVNFPAGRFTQPPRVFLIVRSASVYFAFVNAGATAASVSIGVRHHAGTASTATVPVDVWAVQMLTTGADG